MVVVRVTGGGEGMASPAFWGVLRHAPRTSPVVVAGGVVGPLGERRTLESWSEKLTSSGSQTSQPPHPSFFTCTPSGAGAA